ncbi:DUF523 domain-containing protein [Eubacterium sp. F2]|jgi:uncharacterized protein YbbK (DUF523 family)|uniref:DUF523 domain-containing protein n=1 Tax=Eubacterium sp. F2 TaxID=3381348 RepID=UPI0039083A1C
MYIISACLLGHNCKYNGGNNRNEDVIKFAQEHGCIAVCPETEGGLKAPREPAERQGSRVMSKSGEDWTEYFRQGARRSLKRAEDAAKEAGERMEGAILKARSPSCGYGNVYDGSFTGKTREGDGCFAQLLREKGIPVKTEEDL